MDNKIRSAFDQIQAEDSLKRETKDFLSRKLYRRRPSPLRRIVVSAACFLAALLGLGGYFSYVTPVSAVSIDVNPSIELEINLFNKVIDVIGYNDDGAELADSLSVRHMDYLDAVNAILEDQTITACLLEDNLLEITVSGSSEEKAEEMRDCIASQTNVSENQIYCTDSQEIADAHAVGLSFGKYRAFLAAQAVNPELTVEDAQELTMRELRTIAGSAQNGSAAGQGTGAGNGGQGSGHGYASGTHGNTENGKGHQHGKAGTSGS